MPDTPIFAPDGKVRMIPENQVQAALAAGGKQATKMLDPKGTNRWVPSDQVEAATKAGGTVVKGDNTFTVKPTEGESFLDTMKRAAAAGKSVTPETVTAQTKKGLKEAPAVLAAAPAIGFAGAASLAGVGEAGAAASRYVSSQIPRDLFGNPQVMRALTQAAESHPVVAKLLTKALEGIALTTGGKVAYDFLKK